MSKPLPLPVWDRKAGKLFNEFMADHPSTYEILFRNARQISILATKIFGRFAFVEIGAMSIGRIVQVHPREMPFQRGDEKSVFKFGGSTVFGEPEKWRPAPDLAAMQ
jgi:phosphatidylserine decarboxylase